MAGENCEIHLADSVLTAAQAQTLAKKAEKIAGKNDVELEDIKRQMEAELRTALEDEINFSTMRVMDNIKIEIGYRDALTTYKIDHKTGDKVKVILDNMTDINKNRLQKLVGRGGLDSQHRAIRRRLEKYHEMTESVLQIDKTSHIQKRADIVKGSDEERQFWKAVKSIEHLDPEKVTPDQLTKLIHGKSNVEKLAIAHKLSNEQNRKMMNRYGGTVKYSDQYVVGMNYEWNMIERMGKTMSDRKTAFVDHFMSHLDLKKTFGDNVDDVVAKKALGDIFEDMRKTASERVDEISQTVGGGTRGRSKSRSFVYKDADAEYDTFNKFSSRNVHEAGLADTRGAASTAIKIRNFGYDSQRVLRDINAQIVKDYGSGKMGAIDSFTVARINQAQMELSGQQNYIQTAVTTWANGGRLVNAVTMLGNALSTTVLDAVENNRQAFFVNGKMFGGVVDYANTMRKLISPEILGGWSREEKKELSDILGVVFSYASNAEGMRMASGELTTTGNGPWDWISRKANKVMNLATLLPWQTGYSNISSRVAGQAQLSVLLNSLREGTLSNWQKDTLYEMRLTKGEMNALSKAKIKGISTMSGHNFITGKAIMDSMFAMKPDEVASMLDVPPEHVGQAVLDLAHKIDTFGEDFGSRGTPQPELATKTLMGKTNPREGVRVASGVLLQFMDTPVAQAQNYVDLVKKSMRVHDSRLAALSPIVGHSMVYVGMAVPALLAADATMSIILGRDSLIDRYMAGDEDQRRRVMSTVLNKTMFVPFAAEVMELQFGESYNEDITGLFSGPTIDRIKDTSKLLNPNNDRMTLDKYGKRYMPNSIPVQLLKNHVWGRMNNEL